MMPYLEHYCGLENVIASDIKPCEFPTQTQPEFVHLNVLDTDEYDKVVKKNKITNIIHLSALLSATAEQDLKKAVALNIVGVHDVMDIALHNNCSIYMPSSIAAFGPNSPLEDTPDDCIMDPTTIYGISKVHLEQIGNYYQNRFNLDFRSIRYPGAVSAALPGGGTTDYAIDIFYSIIKGETYDCFLSEDTRLPMMYMDDLVRGTVELIKAPEKSLKQRVFNMAAISFTPRELFAEIKKHYPSAQITYSPDERQGYADSWPKTLQDTNARNQWGWNHEFDIGKMTETMIEKISAKIGSTTNAEATFGMVAANQ